MLGLLIPVAAAALGATAAVILLVAWAVRREDAYLTMAGPPPGRTAHVVRRLLDLHAIGVEGPGQDQRRGQRGGASFTVTGRINYDPGQPGTPPAGPADDWDTRPRSVARV